MPSPPPRRVWTPEQLQRANDLHQQGTSIAAIAVELGLSRSTTRRLLVRVGCIADVSEEVADTRREQLERLMRKMSKGMSLAAAAAALDLDVQSARVLIRAAATLLPEPLPGPLQRQASAVRANLHNDDVRRAAHLLGIDPWWALFLLVDR